MLTDNIGIYAKFIRDKLGVESQLYFLLNYHKQSKSGNYD